MKLRNNPERLSACYKEVTDNIQELQELGELPDCVVVDDIGGGAGGGSGGSAQNIVQLMK